MQREIKFRAKALDNKQWYEGYLSSPDTINVPTVVDGITYYDEVLIDSETIGRFSGLLDKNGVKIYEGDNVRLLGERIYEIKFINGAFCYETDIFFPDGAIALGHNYYFKWDSNKSSVVEVVGNIYDNPELLK